MGQANVPSPQRRVALGSLEISSAGARDAQTFTTPPIKVFEFETVVIEDVRKELVRYKGQARYFVEELGGGVTLEMVEVPSGMVKMAPPATKAHRYYSEPPVKFNTGIGRFFMGKYPVTQAQWRTVAMMPKKRRHLLLEPSALAEGDNLPVVRISWEDAIEFCARLTEHTGRDYRLPNEDQWEYACRAGTETAFAFGDSLTVKVANYGGYYMGRGGKYRVRLVEVGAMGVANKFGLYDMHGNVYEWCQDDRDDEEVFEEDKLLVSAESDKYRVRRGGSWQNKESACRSDHRSFARRWLRNDITGFRIMTFLGSS